MIWISSSSVSGSSPAVPGQQRFVRWHAVGARLAILRLRQDAPGGPSLDVHDLPIP